MDWVCYYYYLFFLNNIFCFILSIYLLFIFLFYFIFLFPFILSYHFLLLIAKKIEIIPSSIVFLEFFNLRKEILKVVLLLPIFFFGTLPISDYI